MTRPNLIWEDVDPDPEVVEASTLDTLYQVLTFALPPISEKRVTMTYYHPPHLAPFMFTGFSIWDWRRSDCQDLVDFVLQDVWGLSKAAPVQWLASGLPAQRPRRTPRSPSRGIPRPRLLRQGCRARPRKTRLAQDGRAAVCPREGAPGRPPRARW